MAAGAQQFLDLAGDGQLDLVQFDGPLPASTSARRTRLGAVHAFHSLPQLELARSQPASSSTSPATATPTPDHRGRRLRLVSVAGRGGLRAGRAGAPGAGRREGPRLVFADGTQSIYLADMSGDGLTDLVRIRNGEVCYWPNLGYGRFGAKVTMDNAPWFDHPDQFDQRRIRLADIDGSGTTDIIYLGRDGVRLYFNQSATAGAQRAALEQFPAHRQSRLGHGRRPARQRHRLPGLVVAAARRCAAADALRRPDGRAEAAPADQDRSTTSARRRACSTRLDQVLPAGQAAGKPWITRLPFPVHVVERVETYDRISRNRFVTRYAYHHGYFDGVEREFRGFGMVEQWDTEEFAALSDGGDAAAGDEHRRSLARAAGPDQDLVPHRRLSRARRVSNFFAGLSTTRIKASITASRELTDAAAGARCCSTTRIAARSG